MRGHNLGRRLRSRTWRNSAIGTAFILALLYSGSGSAWAQNRNMPPAVAAQIDALMEEKRSRTPAQIKMDSQLIYALKIKNHDVLMKKVPLLISGVTPDKKGRVVVDIDAAVTPDLLNQIRQRGGVIIAAVPAYNSVRAELPLANVEAIAGMSGVKFIKPKEQAKTNRIPVAASVSRLFGLTYMSAMSSAFMTGSVTSEGDTTHNAAAARAAYGIDGTGVKVGVISDSADHLAASIASGDCPADTTVISDTPGTGEGTAMMEIVHDLAPGAKLYFATAFISKAQFAANIKALRDNGCSVIIDDVTYFDESPFQDGPIAQAVDNVVASGVHYFSAAANNGNVKNGSSATWEGDFADSGIAFGSKPGKAHSFGANSFDRYTNLFRSETFTTNLFWSDPLGASSNDYDLYITNSANAILAASTNIQNGTQDPFEQFSGAYGGSGVAPETRLWVVKASGADRFLHIDVFGPTFQTNTSGATRGHNAPAMGYGVAAASVHTTSPFPSSFLGGGTNPVEFFSSDGPRRMFYNPDGTAITPGNFSSTGGKVFTKPDITAADGVVTSAAFKNTPLNPFYGTSAAAPHAGAIAALIAQYRPGISLADMRTALTSTALDVNPGGVDITSGFGIVMADSALFLLDRAPTSNAQSVNTSKDTAVAITLTGSDPDGDTIQFTVVSSPTHGSLSGAAPNLTYTPTTGYLGADSFLFKTTDSHGKAGNTATVSINVVGKPTANAQSVTTTQDTAVGVTLTGSDPNSPALALTFTVTANPAHGSLSGTAPNLTYTPSAGYVGSDSFVFKVNNGVFDSSAATVSINVVGKPTANSQSVSTNINTAVGITLTGADPNSPPKSLTFVVTANPAHGTLSGTAPNLTYTPNGGYFGSDSFQFKVNNGFLDSNTATVSMSVNDNVAPTVVSYNVLFGSLSYNLIGSGRTVLPWTITGIRVVFSKPIASGDANSLTGITTTGLSGLGTNTLTWSFAAITKGSFSTSLLGTGADALKDAAGNPLATFSQSFKVLYGDFNGDGSVTAADLVGVNNARSQTYNILADINGDGVVDINDVNIVRSHTGTKL